MCIRDRYNLIVAEDDAASVNKVKKDTTAARGRETLAARASLELYGLCLKYILTDAEDDVASEYKVKKDTTAARGRGASAARTSLQLYRMCMK